MPHKASLNKLETWICKNTTIRNPQPQFNKLRIIHQNSAFTGHYDNFTWIDLACVKKRHYFIKTGMNRSVQCFIRGVMLTLLYNKCKCNEHVDVSAHIRNPPSPVSSVLDWNSFLHWIISPGRMQPSFVNPVYNSGSFPFLFPSLWKVWNDKFIQCQLS